MVLLYNQRLTPNVLNTFACVSLAHQIGSLIWRVAIDAGAEDVWADSLTDSI